MSKSIAQPGTIHNADGTLNFEEIRRVVESAKGQGWAWLTPKPKKIKASWNDHGGGGLVPNPSPSVDFPIATPER